MKINFIKKIFLIFIFSLFLYAPTFASTIARPMSNNGLVGYWNFEESKGSTIAVDRSGSGNTGTLTNGPVSTSSNTGLGQALSLDGVDDYMDAGNAGSLNGFSKITLSLWYYPTSVASCWCDVISKETFDYASAGFGIRVSNSGAVTFTFNNGSKAEFVTGTNYTLNQWNHIVAVYDGTTVNIYKNGVNIGGGSTSGNIVDSVNNLNIGRRVSAGDRNIVGRIDEVRIYNRALSADEIIRLYNLQKPRVGGGANINGLVGYWPLDEGIGTRAEDVSVNNNNGTLTNGPTWTNGKNGKAVNFDGSDDKITTPYVQTAVTAYTVSAWVKVPTSQTNVSTIVQNRGGGAGHSLTLAIDGNGGCGTGCIATNALIFGDDSNSIYIGVASNFKLNDNQWHHVVGTWSASSGSAIAANQFKVYVDGIEDTTTTRSTGSDTSPLTGDSSGVVIGRHDSWSNTAVGLIDDVRVYERQLSAVEIYNLYKGSKASVLGKTKTDRLTNGLVGYWTMDGKDTYGTKTNDLSDNGNTGTLTNGPVLAMGKIQQSFSFDGVDDYVSTTNSISNPTTYSISVWFKTTVASGHKIVGFEDTSTGQSSYNYDRNIYIDTNGKVVFGWWTDTAVTVASISSLNDGNWHNAVATSHGSSATLYIDGASQGGVSSTLPQSYSGYWRIGGYKLNAWPNASDGYFTGSIDDVRIYSRALSSEEVKALYNMGK